MTRPFLMTYRQDWYDCGRVADGFSWPRVIEANGSGKVLSYEKDWATMIGCSGYVTYDINNTEVTILPSKTHIQGPTSSELAPEKRASGKTWKNMVTKSLLKP